MKLGTKEKQYKWDGPVIHVVLKQFLASKKIELLPFWQVPVDLLESPSVLHSQ